MHQNCFCCRKATELAAEAFPNLPLILWNPSIRKSVTLPSPFITYYSHGGHLENFGFGFNAATNDYKVVRVVYLFELEDGKPPLVEVYESSVGSWRSADAKGFPYGIDPNGSQVFLNGSVHWIGHNAYQVDAKFFNMIVTSDLGTDALSVIKLPDSVADQRSIRSFCVSVLGDSLAVIHHVGDSRGFESCCVLVMKQYGVADSWTKQLSIDLAEGWLKVCAVLKNEEALVLLDYWKFPVGYNQGKGLVYYDTISKQMNHIKDSSYKVGLLEFICRDFSFAWSKRRICEEGRVRKYNCFEAIPGCLCQKEEKDPAVSKMRCLLSY